MMRSLVCAMLALSAACSPAPPPLDPAPQQSSTATSTTEVAASAKTNSERIDWNGSQVVFATLDESRSLLSASDVFSRTMGDFDRGVRMGNDAAHTERDFLEYAAAQAQPWPADVRARWTTAANSIGEALRGLEIRFPARVLLVVASGKEEMDAAYTRENAIVVPLAVAQGTADPFSLLAHEMFHVASRHNPKIRDRLYAVLGFHRVPAVAYPKEIAARRITNPDAVTFEHATNVKRKADGALIDVVALFYSNKPLAEAVRAGLSASLALELVELKAGSDPRIIPAATTDYLERASINTDYAIHPEETLADNFSLLLRRRAQREIKVDRPEVLDQIELVLKKP